MILKSTLKKVREMKRKKIIRKIIFIRIQKNIMKKILTYRHLRARAKNNIKNRPFQILSKIKSNKLPKQTKKINNSLTQVLLNCLFKQDRSAFK
jgi:hypothetical protein